MRRKGFNRALSMVLAFSVAFSMVSAPATATASERTETEFQTNPADMAAGETMEMEESEAATGTIKGMSEPGETDGFYHIGTADELRWFAEYVNSGNGDANAVLTENIDLGNEEWVPIGNLDNPYTGIFDGGNFEITNLSLHTANNWSGLFSKSQGTIKNIGNLTGIVESTNVGAGGIAGWNASGGVIQNSKSSVTIYLKESTARGNAGGITAQNNGTVEACIFSGIVDVSGTAGSKRVGGVSGENTGIVKGCINEGQVTGYSQTAASYMGGVVGNQDGGYLYYCYNTGSISAESDAVNTNVGGVTGRCGNAVLINCYNSGIIRKGGNTEDAKVNGIAGMKTGSARVSNNYFLAETTNESIGALSESDLKSESIISSLNADNAYDIVIEDAYRYVKTPGYPALSWEGKDKPTGPVEIVSVLIEGIAKTGEKLTAVSSGPYGAIPTNLSYQWEVSDSGVNFTEIDGAAASEFVIPDNFAGKFLTVTVYGENNSFATAEPTYMIEKSDAAKVAEAKSELKLELQEKITSAATIQLPGTGLNDCMITWETSDSQLITKDGVVKLPLEGIAEVTLTAKIQCNNAEDTKEFKFRVYSEAANGDEAILKEVTEKYQWGALIPKFEEDKNIITYLENDIKAHNFDGVAVSIKSVKVSSSSENLKNFANISEDGSITYYYYNPAKLNEVFYNKAVYFNVTFELAKGSAVKELNKQVNIYWDIDKVKETMNQELLAKVDDDVIKGSNHSTAEVKTDLILPKYVGDGRWSEISWISTNTDVISIGKTNPSDFYSDYKGTVKRGTKDEAVKLIAIFTFNYTNSGEAVALNKEFIVNVKGVDSTEIKQQMQKELDEKYTLSKLKYSGTNTQIDTEGVNSDIQFLTPGKTGITDYSNYKFTVTSNDEDILRINGYRGNIYRPLPGKEAKEVTFTVTMTNKNIAGLSVTKDFTVRVLPLTQKEIDRASALMKDAKTAYFEAIKGENTDAQHITENLHAFREIIFDEEGNTLKYIYDVSNETDKGISPVDIVLGNSSEAFNLFKSSKPNVIAHENLLVTQPEYDTEVTIESCLSSTEFERYAVKYPDNKEFAQLYRQPVKVTVIVLGKNGENPDPDAKITVGFSLYGDTAHGENGHEGYQKWIDNLTVTAEEGDTVSDVFRKALVENGYVYQGSESYVVSITNPAGIVLAEGINGRNSGWMYEVNGVLSDKTMNQHILSQGDQVLWYYTDDYTQEYIPPVPPSPEPPTPEPPAPTPPTPEKVAAASVKISSNTLHLVEGQKILLKATVLPENASDKSVAWESSNKSAASVDNNGNVTAVKAGKATITVTTHDGGKKAVCTITVNPNVVHVQKVSINPHHKTLYKGKSLKLSVSVLPSNAANKKVTWKSSNTSVAAINQNGKVKAKKAGIATITVTTADGKLKGSCEITVKEIKAVSVKLNTKTKTIRKGNKISLKAKLRPQKSTDKIKWTSSDRKKAKVSKDGVVTGLKAGTVTIKAKATSGKWASCKIIVKEVKAKEVRLNKRVKNLRKGYKVTLKASVFPKNSTDTLKWISSNPKIATVTSKGVVNGIKRGNASITVKTSSGMQAVCEVRVK